MLPTIPTTGSPRRSNEIASKGFVFLVCWAIIVLLFASQWYGYDGGHGLNYPFLYYLGWSAYLWGVLTPLVMWLARIYPVEANTWMRAIPIHVASSILLTLAQLSIEASVKWLRTGAEDSLATIVRHYLRQHTQIGLLTYWLLFAATQLYRMHDQARKRQLRAAQLEARLAEAQIENLRTQLHPHFLFNTLQAAVTLIPEDPEGAEDVLLRLSELLRISLDEMYTQEISLARELEFLGHYIAIQQRRFGDRLGFEIQVVSDLLECAVPTLLLQPLVENAIRHGINKHKEKDVVTIRGFQNGKQLCLEVINLTSRLKGATEDALSQGVGLSNTLRRLEHLYGIEQSLSLCNLEPRGVCVRILVPMHQVLSHQKATPEMTAA
jgi:two-component system LytT family sensor kinase